MLTRRQFQARLIASFTAATLPIQMRATVASRSDLWLNRLTFGSTPETRAAFVDPMVWLETQLAMPVEDAALDARLAAARLRIAYENGADENGHNWNAIDELRPLNALNNDPADQLYCIDWEQGMDYSERTRPAAEVVAASMIRAVHAPAQLREVLAQFWHDHFNVNSQKDEYTAVFFPSYDAIMRRHAFGNFRELLGEVARSPAMLYYLNNADSRASPANENWARELLELHTLGAGNYLNDLYDDWKSVPGASDGLAQGYLDLDVYEVARAFTGWSIGDGRYVTDSESTPKTGRFHYVETWHDPYQKRILGVEFLPNRGPMEDGDQVMDILAAHPGTARFVTTKLIRRLLTDTPDPAMVDTISAVFLAAMDDPDQIAQVIRAIVAHLNFSATPPSKLRRPFEFMVAMYRATGAEVISTENAFQWQLIRAGWKQHEYGPPTGHPDTADKWTGASSMNRLVDIAFDGHDDWFGVAKIDLQSVAADGEPVEELVDRWAGRLGAAPGHLAVAMGLDPAVQAASLTGDERWGIAAGAVAFAAISPDFLLR